MRVGKLSCLVVAVVCAAPVFAQRGPMNVVAERAQMRPLPATMHLVATVEPAVHSILGAEVEGLVVEMPAREGDLIAAGAVICRLNDDTRVTSLVAARARLDMLQAEHAKLETGTRPEELARLKAAYGEAQARHQQWTAERERIRGLEQAGRTNPKEVFDVEADYAAAEQRMLSAKAAYEEGVNGPRAEDITQARCAAAEQAAVVDQAERDLAKTVIRAPFAGYVVKRETEAGQWVARGGPVVELADLSRVLVTTDAPERAFPFVKVGDEASVQVDALSEVFAGRVKHVVPQADEAARTFPVQIEIDNPDGKLRGGMIAWSTLVTGAETPMVAVPKDAVDVRQGTSTVCMVVPGAQGLMAIPTSVTTGADIEDWVAITSGNIPPDAIVVVRGNERVMFPMPVAVTNMDVPGAAPPTGEKPTEKPETDETETPKTEPQQ